jgi:hypothetical protein
MDASNVTYLDSIGIWVYGFFEVVWNYSTS